MNEHLEHFNSRLAQAFALRGLAPELLTPSGGGLLSDELLQARHVTPELANQVLSEVSGCDAVDPTMVSFAPEFLAHATTLLPMELVFREKVFPLRHEGNYVHVVMARPQDPDCLRLLEQTTSSRVKPYCCHGKGIVEAIRLHYKDARPPDARDDDVPALLAMALKAVSGLKAVQAPRQDLVNNVHVIRLLRAVLIQLVRQGTSDLHFEARETGYAVRLRKDGVMRTAWVFPVLIREALTQRLKLMAGLDLDERLRPQDGSIDYALVPGRDMDIRVSSLPAVYGEKLVLRILDKGKRRITLQDLGLESEDAALLEQAVKRPNGLVLVTGPTGSGKSTTLYAVLQELNTDEVNIVTAEDPVEYRLDGITQVNCGGELGFAAVIRSFLRQDPDIVMVGEIRDTETADFAAKAAMTGHLVLSTLHTNDAPSAVTRLVNMGLPPYLVASSQLTVVAQRLLRRLCPQCKVPAVPDARTLARIPELQGQEQTIHAARGCEACGGSGYAGRVGVYEILPVSEAMEKLILDNAPAGELRRMARVAGRRSLRQAAVAKLLQGVTSCEEVLRATLDA